MDPFLLATFIVAFLSMMIGILAILFIFMERDTNSERARRHGHKVKYVLDGEKYSKSQLKHGFETDSGVLKSGNVVALVDKDKHLNLYHVTKRGGDPIDATHLQYQLPKNSHTQTELIVIQSNPALQRTIDAQNQFYHANLLWDACFPENVGYSGGELIPNPNMAKRFEMRLLSAQTPSGKVCNLLAVRVTIHFTANPIDSKQIDSEQTVVNSMLSGVPYSGGDTLIEVPCAGFSIRNQSIEGDTNNPQFTIAKPVNLLGVFWTCTVTDLSESVTVSSLGYPRLEINQTGIHMYQFSDEYESPLKYDDFFGNIRNKYSQYMDCTIVVKGLFAEDGTEITGNLA